MGSNEEEISTREMTRDAMLRAVKLGRKSEVEDLLDAGAELNNAFEIPLLHVAVVYGHYELISLLVQRGADLNETASSHGYKPIHMLMFALNKDQCLRELIKIDGQLESLDNYNNNTLHLMVENCPTSIDIIEQLIELGLDPNAVNIYGFNCFHILAFNRLDDPDELLGLVNLFLKHGVEINLLSSGDFKQTPLHIATRNGKPDLVKFLLLNGSDINMEDSAGEIAIDLLVAFLNTPNVNLRIGPFTRTRMKVVYIRFLVLRVYRKETVSHRIIEKIRTNDDLALSFYALGRIMDQLKKIRIHEGFKVTYFDILCGRRDRIAKYLRNKRISESLQKYKYNDGITQLFKPEIMEQLKKARQFLDKVDETSSLFNDILGHVLPYSCTETIAFYYCSSE